MRKHNPAISFTAISGSPERCANIQPLHAFRPDAADFSWVVPNMCHDMHDCSVAEGDAWLASFVPQILASPDFAPGGTGTLYITFDESDGPATDNEIVTAVLGPRVKAGTRARSRTVTTRSCARSRQPRRAVPRPGMRGQHARRAVPTLTVRRPGFASARADPWRPDAPLFRVRGACETLATDPVMG